MLIVMPGRPDVPFLLGFVCQDASICIWHCLNQECKMRALCLNCQVVGFFSWLIISLKGLLALWYWFARCFQQLFDFSTETLYCCTFYWKIVVDAYRLKLIWTLCRLYSYILNWPQYFWSLSFYWGFVAFEIQSAQKVQLPPPKFDNFERFRHTFHTVHREV